MDILGSLSPAGRGAATRFIDDVVAAFERQAARCGDQIAIQSGRQILSYAELNRRADHMCAALLARGLPARARIAVCFEPGPLTAVAVLGILKAGMAYVPLSPADPAERQAYIIADAAVALAITQAELRADMAAVAPDLIVLDLAEAAAPPAAAPAPRAADPDSLAYLMYTSGSTGKPKGVMITRRNLAYYLDWHCHHLRPEMGDVDLPLTSSMCFAAGVTQFYAPLMLGRTQHVLERDLLRQPALLLDWYRAHPGFGLYCVPSVWNEVLKCAEALAPAERPAGPACVVLSGEAVHDVLIERAARIWPSLRIWNLYGPTEATANASYAELRAGAPISIGRAISGSEVFLLDEHLREVGPGQAGEICICGDGVALGYANLPELTRQRFVSNPLSLLQGRPLFRTGDLGRYNARGEMIYIGRRDFQVKIRGVRIECGEIEAALADHPAIRMAVVVCREEGLDKTLAAYLVFHPGADVPVDRVRAALATRLPEAMLPSAWVVLEALPTLSNGKIDRVSLPPPGRARPALSYPCVAPRTATERKLLRVWEQVLGLDGLGIDDHFFELGGDSLRVAAAIGRIKAELGVALDYRRFFDHPTPAALAEGLPARAVSAVLRAPVARVVDLAAARGQCSPGQEGLWLLAQTYPALGAYNMRFTLRLHGELDDDALNASLAAMVAAHDALRTVFTQVGGRPVASVRATLAVPVGRVDLRHLDAAGAARQCGPLAAEDGARPFDLEHGPLLRFTRFDLPDDEHRLQVAVHHIVFDGRSIGLFCRELIDQYRSRTGGPAPRRAIGAGAGVGYGDWLRWRATRDDGPGLAFWRRHLDGCQTMLEMPTDYQRPAVRSFRGAVSRLAVPARLSDALAAFNRRYGATSFMTLFAVFNLLLYRHSGQRDLLLACPAANREHPAAAGTIGLFANTMVMRTRLDGADTFAALLAQVRASSLACLEHQSFPFEKLVEALQPERGAGRAPLVQAMFVFQEKLYRGAIDDRLHCAVYEDGNDDAKYELTLEVQDREERPELRLSYNTDLYAQGSAERLLRQYLLLLEQVLDDAGRALGAYDLVGAADLALLTHWNATSDGAAPDTVMALFERQAAATPHAPALASWDRGLTYAELERQANQLAHHLVAAGAGAGQWVGVHLEPSADLVVTLLAILKAGSAYVPLDPNFPSERLADIIADAGLALIATQRSHLARLPACPVPAVVVDGEREQIAGRPGYPPANAATPHSLMYVMYTSGSTGRPKGVKVPHAGVCNQVRWMRTRFPLAPADKVLGRTSINFDISVWEIFLPLISGAQLHLGRREQMLAPDTLGALVRAAGITQIQFVPSALRAFADAGQLELCPSLRRIFCGGEALSLTLHDDVLARFDGELHNLYGPTETSIYACHWACRRGERLRSVPIGRPVANVVVHILDATLRPVPIGTVGELYIGGIQVAHGYHRRPELTARVFLPDPWPDPRTPRATLFKTGDLGRYWHDGTIEFLGRADRQVKVRGHRIELAEIEHHLLRHPGVRHAVVLAREDRPGDVRLVAYLQAAAPGGADAAALRQHLKRTLPAYMIPAAFVELDAMPLLPNNKTDLAALPRPEYRQAPAAADAPRHFNSATELALAQIWQSLLGDERFGPDDSFFDVGGHSLLMTSMRDLIVQRLQVEVGTITLFQYPTIRGLARHLADGGAPGDAMLARMAQRAARRDQHASRRPPAGAAVSVSDSADSDH
ncbi:amino acid adenylation domain-containing protein [Duganella sp. 1411]|uniref:non-ribosomal peptide synthetase n=1 Tax=Duganella sp. 1411 TaxID=2806572 RepID=UPI001AE9F60C|nr:non-ribosomal peptide synthetase [Duganella sp. 1411]MBP1202449.1 amino acid adenylation domain-containing protein [Duganella sp. 1411]